MNTRTFCLAVASVLAIALLAAARPASAQSPEEGPSATPMLLQVGLDHILAGELTAEDGGEDLYSFEAIARTQYIIEVKAEVVFDPVNNGNPSFVPPPQGPQHPPYRGLQRRPGTRGAGSGRIHA